MFAIGPRAMGERCVERSAGKELTTPNVRRAAARQAMRDHDLSQRLACRLVGVDPKTVRRDKPRDNPEVREEMKAIAAVRRRFGYRRIGVLLERKGMVMNHKKLYRLYTEEKLGVRRRRGRKRALGSRTPMPVALRPGERPLSVMLASPAGQRDRWILYPTCSALPSPGSGLFTNHERGVSSACWP